MPARIGKKEAILLASAVAICLLLLEGVVRIALPMPARQMRVLATASAISHPADPEIGWVLPRQAVRGHHRYVNPSGKVDYDVWYSVRDGERVSSAREMSGPDLVATGCSFTFGHGLADADTWPWQLQERLPEYRVHNVGCMAYGTDQALLAADRKLAALPHARAVLLGFANFHIERNRGAQSWLRIVYPYRKPLFRLQGDTIENRGLIGFWPPGPVLDGSYLVDHLVNTAANRWYGIQSREQARELTIRMITGYADKLRSRGIRFAVLMMPYVEDFTAQRKEDHALVLRRLQAVGIPTVAVDIPRLANGRLDVEHYMVSKIDTHPNRRFMTAVVDQAWPVLQATVAGPVDLAMPR